MFYQELVKAINERNFNKIREFIKRGEDPNSVIAQAIKNKDLEVTKLLLQEGANPSFEAFQTIVKNDLIEFARLFLDFGLVKRWDFHALNIESQEIGELLIDFNVINYSTLLNNIEKKNELSEELYKKFQNKIIADDILQHAVVSNKLEAVKWAIEKGANPNRGIEVIDINSNIEILSYLVEKGGNLNFLISGYYSDKILQSPNLEFFLDNGMNINLLYFSIVQLDYTKEVIDLLHSKNLDAAKCLNLALIINDKEAIDFYFDKADYLLPSGFGFSLRINNEKIINKYLDSDINPSYLLKEILEVGEFQYIDGLINKGINFEDLINNLPELNYRLGDAILEELVTKFSIDDPLDFAVRFGSNKIIEKYLKNSTNKNTIIGFSNQYGKWSHLIKDFLEKAKQEIPNLYFINIDDEKDLNNESFMSIFSGFINPGADDSYPTNGEFTLSNFINPTHNEKIYQKIISYSVDKNLPYIGICAGSQHLILNQKGTLNKAPIYNQKDIKVNFISGTMSYFLTLSNNEQKRLIDNCIMPDVVLSNVYVAHKFSAVNGKLGNTELGALSEEGIVEAVSLGAKQFGFQFHPENYEYGSNEETIERQKNIWYNFIKLAIEHNDLQQFANFYQIGEKEINNYVKIAEEKLLNRLESCSNLNYCPKNNDYIPLELFNNFENYELSSCPKYFSEIMPIEEIHRYYNSSFVDEYFKNNFIEVENYSSENVDNSLELADFTQYLDFYNIENYTIDDISEEFDEGERVKILVEDNLLLGFQVIPWSFLSN